jgi:hypothetical protein
MEVMDTSLDKFYKMVEAQNEKIPEEVIGKIALAVSWNLRIKKCGNMGVCCRWSKPCITCKLNCMSSTVMSNRQTSSSIVQGR